MANEAEKTKPDPKTRRADNTVDTGGGTYIGGNVNTGGGTFVGRDQINRTAFDQRGQTVHGSQTNIEGGVQTSGGIFNSGIINTNVVPSRTAVLAELHSLLAVVTQVGEHNILDAEDVIDAESFLRKAVIQVSKTQPDGQLIIVYLVKAREIVTAIAEQVVAVRGLVAAIDRVIELVRKWLAGMQDRVAG